MRSGALCLLLAAGLTAALVHADPVALRTTELGQGPAIVFVHGLGCTSLDWLPTVKRLRDHYRSVLVDLPGCGESALPDPFTLESAGEALDGVLAHQRAESTIVVGQGVGGLVALYALAAHPDHAAGLVLVDTQIKSPMAISAQDRDQFLQAMDENYAQFAPMLFSKMGRDSTESARMYANVASLKPLTVKAYLRQLLVADGNRSLKALPHPPQVLFTERIWKTGASWGTVARNAGYEDTTFTRGRRIADAGALVMRDQPDTLAAILAGFAAQHMGAHK